MFKKKSFIIGLVLLSVMTFVAVNGIKSGYKGNSNPIRKYSSVSSLHKESSFNFNVPEVLLNETDLVYENISNYMVNIYNDSYIFRAAPFVHEDADLGGNYDTYDFDKSYDVNGETSITKLRIRYNEDGENTILTWVSSGVSYYLDIRNRSYTEDILDILGLTMEDLDEQIEHEISISKTILGIFNAEITIPENISLTVIEDKENEVALFMMENILVFTIGKQNNIEGDVTSIELTSGYKLNYISKDTFEQYNKTLDEYNKLIDNVEEISESFNVLN